MKKYYMQTFGCQANERDSQIMAGTLEALGFLPTEQYKDADVLIVNTCSVRQKSEDKVYGWGLKLGQNGYKKPKGQVVFVTGCMIGSAKGKRTRINLDNLQKKLSWADYLLAPDEEIEIPNILIKEKLIDESMQDRTVAASGRQGVMAYVNISTGCDNFCTFCVVPYARGEEKSRPREEILAEVKHLASRDFKNIMLVGQNVNSWGLDRKTKFKLRAGSHHKIPFAQLLLDIHKIKGVKKISFISSNPFDFTQDLIDTLALPKIDKYLHMAVQSGDNEVLKRMNRRHTIEEFEELVGRIKQKVPEMRFGTDIIVGFPGETKEQFQKTINLFKKIKFEVAYISMYSPRQGTIAQKMMEDDVPKKEKQRRHRELTKVWRSGDYPSVAI